MCLNCMGTLSEILLHNLPQVNRQNFSSCILSKHIFNTQPIFTKPPKTIQHMSHNVVDRPIVLGPQEKETIKKKLLDRCHCLIQEELGEDGTIVPSHFFGQEDAEKIVNNLNTIHNPVDMNFIIKGKAFRGQVGVLFITLNEFRSNPECSR